MGDSTFHSNSVNHHMYWNVLQWLFHGDVKHILRKISEPWFRLSDAMSYEVNEKIAWFNLHTKLMITHIAGVSQD